MPRGKDRACRLVLHAETVGSESRKHAAYRKPVTLRYLGIVPGVAEDQGENARVDEVLPVDAGVGKDDDRADAEETRRERGVLPARALPIVLSSDEDAAAGRARPGRKASIQRLESKFGYHRKV